MNDFRESGGCRWTTTIYHQFITGVGVQRGRDEEGDSQMGRRQHRHCGPEGGSRVAQHRAVGEWLSVRCLGSAGKAICCQGSEGEVSGEGGGDSDNRVPLPKCFMF